MKLKSDAIKIYGITQFPATREYMIVLENTINDKYNDRFASKRSYCNGICANCNRFNTSTNWCLSCDPYKITREWTSDNKDIDVCIKEFQLCATNREKAIEWIPFNKLNVIKEIGKGGFGTVFLANWQQSISNTSSENDNLRSPQFIEVALKTLPGSKKNSDDFLKEVSQS